MTQPQRSAPEQKRILIISGHHFLTASRKVDLHFMAESMVKLGFEVDFLSTRLSWLSRWLNDGRWAFAATRPLNQWTQVDEALSEFIWVTPVHPLNLKKRVLNCLTAPIFRHYGALLPRVVRERLSGYSYIFVESGLPPLLFKVLKAHAPQATFIYHAADRLSVIGVHPVVEEVLNETVRQYDLVRIVAEDLRGDFPKDMTVELVPHGIHKDVFDDAGKSSPYTKPHQAVSVGDMLFDADTVEAFARLFPDFTIHLFGKKSKLAKPLPNVIAHGEKPFAEIVPYILHADIGLAPYRDVEGSHYLCQSSLKMMQYTYARLPIVAPYFARGSRTNVCTYMPGDTDSMAKAWQAALDFDRNDIDTSSIMTWDEVTHRVLELAKKK